MRARRSAIAGFDAAVDGAAVVAGAAVVVGRSDVDVVDDELVDDDDDVLDAWRVVVGDASSSAHADHDRGECRRGATLEQVAPAEPARTHRATSLATMRASWQSATRSAMVDRESMASVTRSRANASSARTVAAPVRARSPSREGSAPSRRSPTPTDCLGPSSSTITPRPGATISPGAAGGLACFNVVPTRLQCGWGALADERDRDDHGDHLDDDRDPTASSWSTRRRSARSGPRRCPGTNTRLEVLQPTPSTPATTGPSGPTTTGNGSTTTGTTVARGDVDDERGERWRRRESTTADGRELGPAGDQLVERIDRRRRPGDAVGRHGPGGAGSTPAGRISGRLTPGGISRPGRLSVARRRTRFLRDRPRRSTTRRRADRRRRGAPQGRRAARSRPPAPPAWRRRPG